MAERDRVRIWSWLVALIPLVMVLLLAYGAHREIEQFSRGALRANTLAAASSYVEVLERFRTLYTSEVVNRLPLDKIRVVHNYSELDNAIPLPATLTKMLLTEQATVEVRLYSNHPFPWRRAGHSLDKFEWLALSALRNDPGRPFYRFVRKGEELQLRYAKADLMRAECVDCHNRHPDTPKDNWKVGDVRGVLEIIISMDDLQNSYHATSRRLLLLGLLGSVVVLASQILWLRLTR